MEAVATSGGDGGAAQRTRRRQSFSTFALRARSIAVMATSRRSDVLVTEKAGNTVQVGVRVGEGDGETDRGAVLADCVGVARPLVLAVACRTGWVLLFAAFGLVESLLLLLPYCVAVFTSPPFVTVVRVLLATWAYCMAMFAVACLVATCLPWTAVSSMVILCLALAEALSFFVVR